MVVNVGHKKTSQLPAFRRTLQRQMADYQERVAERIVRAREAAGYDREPFALRAGISPKTLTRIESGKTEAPRLATLRQIAKAAKVPLKQIRPDLEAEERELRDQLDRIEALLRLLMKDAGLSEHGSPPSMDSKDS